MTQKPEHKSGLLAALDRGEYSCTLMQIIEGLGEPEAKAVLQAVENIRTSTQKRDWRRTGFTVAWLVNALCDNDIPVTYRQVERHVKKQCLCGT